MKIKLFFLIFVLSNLSFSSSEIYNFTSEFMIGAATASYQIEGAWNVDGKIPSIWDTATHRQPNGVADGSTGDVAGNSYYFYEKDIEKLKDVGFEVYRFSVAWTRILTKNMQVNPAGIDYYKRLIDALLREGIKPMLTMYHWDLPQWLQDLGGWTSPEMIKYFEFYADILFKNFGDRVKMWITFNEPAIFCGLGYSQGAHAPHIRTSRNIGLYLCAHHVILSHATVYHMYKDKYFAEQQGEVGINVNSGHTYRMYPNVTEEVIDRDLQFKIGHYVKPIFIDGDYPEIMRTNIDRKSADEGRTFSRLPKFTDEQKAFVRGTSDFLALNYYSSGIVAPLSDLPGANLADSDSEIWGDVDRVAWEQAKSDWLFSVPEGLHDHLVWIKNNTNNVKVYITENGFSDEPMLTNDTGRARYLDNHLAAISRAINFEGCNVQAYTVWSLVDNFEWMMGYTERFGIFAINFDDVTKTRVEKDSVQIFRDLIPKRWFESDWIYKPYVRNI